MGQALPVFDPILMLSLSANLRTSHFTEFNICLMDRMLFSIAEVFPVIEHLLAQTGAQSVVEIGAMHGAATRLLGGWAKAEGGTVDVIDLWCDPKLHEAIAPYPEHITLHPGNSLEQLSKIENRDVFIIDSDHNYYTTATELKMIMEQNTPLFFVIHDVAWPWARRDDYADPDAIPAEHRHEYTSDGGVIQTEAGFTRTDFRWGGFHWAVEEGGERNGILTAVEDFLKTEDRYTLFTIDAIFGYGFLVRKDLPNFAAIADYLTAYTDNFLLSKLERNRLDLFLGLIATEEKFDEAQQANANLSEEVASLQAQLQQAQQERDALQDRLHALWQSYQDLESTLDQRESGLLANLAIYQHYEADYDALARRAAAERNALLKRAVTAEQSLDNIRQSQSWRLIARWWAFKRRLGGR